MQIGLGNINSLLLTSDAAGVSSTGLRVGMTCRERALLSNKDYPCLGILTSDS